MEDNNAQAAADQLAETTGSIVKIQEMEAMFASKYNYLFELLLKASSDLSARQVSRALFNAVDLGVQSGLAPKLVSKDEAKFAGYLAQLLDLRNVKLATNLQKEEIQKQQNKETNNVTE